MPLACRELTAAGRLYVPAHRVEAKVRHRAAAVPATVEEAPGGFRVRFDEPVEAVARGQVAALYVDEAVVGAGVITGSSG